jgi:hypothetical protein
MSDSVSILVDDKENSPAAHECPYFRVEVWAFQDN